MDTLRLILLLIGLAIILAIYLYARKASGKSLLWRRTKPAQQEEIVKVALTEEDIAGAFRDKRYASDQPDEEVIEQLSATLSRGVQDKVDNEDVESVPSLVDEGEVEPLLIVMTIMSRSGKLFNGMDVLDIALANGLVHGEMNIFHYYPDQQSSNRVVCSLANAVEPGYFDMDNIEQVQTPGLTLFMQLPGPMDSRSAFEQTLKLGRAMAEQLQGDLCDETRSVLTMQTIEHLKEKVEAHMFKARMKQIKQHRH
jgi:cell division protein ZipA